MLAAWMAPYPVIGGLNRGVFRAWITPILQRDVGGMAPLRAILTTEEVARSCTSSDGEVRVRAEDWPEIHEALERLGPGQAPLPGEHTRKMISPGRCASARPCREAMRLALSLATRWTEDDLAQQVREGAVVQAFALQVDLLEAEELAQEENTSRLGALLGALQEVGDDHVSALLRLLRSNDLEHGEEPRYILVRKKLSLDSTARGFRLIGVGVPLRALQGHSNIDPLLDWMTTVVADLEARRIPARLGLAFRSVHRFEAPHAITAGHPWIFDGELLEEVQQAARHAAVEILPEGPTGVELRLRPCLTTEALDRLATTTLREGVEPCGETLSRLAPDALTKIAQVREDEVLRRLDAAGRPMREAVQLRRGLPLVGSDRDPDAIARNLLTPWSRGLIRRSLDLASKDGTSHAVLQGLAVLLLPSLWIALTPEDQGLSSGGAFGAGPRFALFLLTQLATIALGSLLFGYTGTLFFERVIVLRLIPTFNRAYFELFSAEVFERASLRLRTALAAPTAAMRARLTLALGGPGTVVFWWRFLLGRGRTTCPPPGDAHGALPSLRWPVPRGRLRPREVGSYGNSPFPAKSIRSVVFGRRWLNIPHDSRPHDMQEFAAWCAWAGVFSYVVAGLLSSLLWTLLAQDLPDRVQKETLLAFTIIPLLGGAVMCRAFYLRLCHIDLNTLYMRRVDPASMRVMFARHREFVYLSILAALFVSLPMVHFLSSSLGMTSDILLPGSLLFTLVCVLGPVTNKWTVKGIFAGSGALALYFAYIERAQSFAWSVLVFGVALVATDLARALAPYQRMDWQRFVRLTASAEGRSSSTDTVALIPSASGVQMVEVHSALLRRGLQIIAETGSRDASRANVRLPVSRDAFEAAIWFVSDQRGNALVLGGQGRTMMEANLRDRLHDVSRLYEGGALVSRRIGQLIRLARPGQIIEVFVYLKRSESGRSVPVRLFLQAIEADGLSMGFLGCTVPTEI